MNPSFGLDYYLNKYAKDGELLQCFFRGSNHRSLDDRACIYRVKALRRKGKEARPEGNHLLQNSVSSFPT